MTALSEPQVGRVGILDDLRGIGLAAMVLYHGAYDLIFLFEVHIPLFFWSAMPFLQACFAGMFIAVSGASSRYSRNNRKRGLQTLGVGLLMTLVTALVMPDQIVLFGILHFMGTAMVLYSFLEPFLHRIRPLPGILLMSFLYAFTYRVVQGRVGLPGLFSISLPRGLYDCGFLFPLGFVGQGFFSSDYFPLLPWVFIFFAGAYCGVWLREGRAPATLYRTHVPAAAWLGRHALAVYILHQPVLYGILWVFFRIWRS